MSTNMESTGGSQKLSKVKWYDAITKDLGKDSDFDYDDEGEFECYDNEGDIAEEEEDDQEFFMLNNTSSTKAMEKFVAWGPPPKGQKKKGGGAEDHWPGYWRQPYSGKGTVRLPSAYHQWAMKVIELFEDSDTPLDLQFRALNICTSFELRTQAEKWKSRKPLHSFKYYLLRWSIGLQHAKGWYTAYMSNLGKRYEEKWLFPTKKQQEALHDEVRRLDHKRGNGAAQKRALARMPLQHQYALAAAVLAVLPVVDATQPWCADWFAPIGLGVVGLFAVVSALNGCCGEWTNSDDHPSKKGQKAKAVSARRGMKASQCVPSVQPQKQKGKKKGKKNPILGLKKGPSKARLSAATEAYKRTILNPFSGRGARIPDGISYPMVVRNIKGGFQALVSNADNMGGIFFASPTVSYIDTVSLATNQATDVMSVASTSMTPFLNNPAIYYATSPSSLGNVFGKHRVVSAGLCIRVDNPLLTRQGRLIIAPIFCSAGTPGWNSLNTLKISYGLSMVTQMCGGISVGFMASPALLNLPGAREFSFNDLGAEDIVLSCRPQTPAAFEMKDSTDATAYNASYSMAGMGAVGVSSGAYSVGSIDASAACDSNGFLGWCWYADGYNAETVETSELIFEFIYHMEGTPQLQQSGTNGIMAVEETANSVVDIDGMNQVLAEVSKVPLVDAIAIGVRAFQMAA